eukprot:1662719-Amphidinium_carterae.1
MSPAGRMESTSRKLAVSWTPLSPKFGETAIKRSSKLAPRIRQCANSYVLFMTLKSNPLHASCRGWRLQRAL